VCLSPFLTGWEDVKDEILLISQIAQIIPLSLVFLRLYNRKGRVFPNAAEIGFTDRAEFEGIFVLILSAVLLVANSLIIVILK
jgi:hypothetical protein